VSFEIRTAVLIAAALTVCSCLTAQTADPGASQTTPPAATGSGQSPPPQGAPPPAPAATPTWSVGAIDFSGLVDGYYTFNNDHPSSGFNQLYNFNERANQFSLNMLKLTASHDPDPVGFRVDLGFGRAFDTIHAAEKSPDIFRYVEQAFVSVKPKGAKGFEADFGDFVTSAGAEVIETKDNWNYSRSLLFSYAIPYYHFGLRTSMPLGSFNVGFQLVNGWNNIEDNNSGKTIGITGGVTRKKFTWSNNYYVGPEKSDTNHGYRNLYDTTLLLTPNDKVSAYLNFDYGHERRITTGIDRWIGFAGALHYQLNKYLAITPRAEYYDDATGFTTGTRQKLHEVTVTGEYKMVEGLLARLEYRRDDSNTPFYDRGGTPAAGKTQTTITLGLVAFFGPKRQ
jgi:hypothetical protein